MQTLMAAVRRACSPAAWSRGVELSRAGAVLGERSAPDEIEIRVTTQGGLPSPLVVLYPQDQDWSCDCNSRDEACVHVAAAVIALSQARRDGTTLPSAKSSLARLRYHFSRTPEGLGLDRHLLEPNGNESPLQLSLTVLAKRADSARLFIPSPSDTAVDVVLAGGRARGLLSRQTLLKTLQALVDCPEVLLEGRPVAVGDPQPVLRCRLEGRAGGWFLSLRQDPQIKEIFANGAVLCGDTLRPVGDLQLTAAEVDELRKGRWLGPDDIPELVTNVLPKLKARVPVDLVGVTLPETRRIAPHIVLEAQREGDALTVLPTLVYGDPPTARVDLGVLKYVRHEGPIVVRDERAEAQLSRQLQTALDLQPGHKIVARGAQAIALAAQLQTWRGPITGDGPKHFFLAPELQPHLSGNHDDFSLEFATATAQGRTTVATAAVLQAWQQGDSLVPLLEGGWAPLPRGWLDRFGQRILDLLAAKDASQATLPAAAQLDLAALYDALNQPKPPKLAKLQQTLVDFAGIAAAPLPADLKATLRDYQRCGVNWLVFLRSQGMGAMLADDMGLGKTLQALCAIEGRTLVVAPTSVLHNWAAEAARFRPSLRVNVYHGPTRALLADHDVTLTTYSLLRLDGPQLAQQKWDTVVLDEAQNIKNPESQVAQAAYQLSAQFRMTLTGTPVENRLDELWSQFHFINRGLLGGRQDFATRYAKPIADGVAGVANLLRERIRPFMLRRLKRSVAPELPPRTDVVLKCTLSTAERVIYDAIRAATMADVLEKLQAGGNVMAALEALLRLRQACCHPALVPGQSAGTSAKVDLLLETLEEALSEGHKALVFSQWTGLLDLVQVPLRSRGIQFARLDGSTVDRAAVVQSFQENAEPKVMLVSLKAGGTGLNLTAADHVFLLDPWWNPAAEDQAADRAHRIGQERPVLVHRLVAENTVEERILALQEQKRAVAAAALEGSDRSAALTRDDLLTLLR